MNDQDPIDGLPQPVPQDVPTTADATGTPVPAIPPVEPTPARAAQPAAFATTTQPTEASLESVGAVLTPTSPVEVGRAARPSRARWAIAGLVALLVVALSGIGLFALVGASSDSVVSAWTPSDAIVYAEVRADLPGDQRQNLGRFLAHFPGFADQSTLETKLDQTLDKLVGQASGGKHDWSKEIKPWFGGQVAVSMSAFPTLSFGDPSVAADSTRALLVVSQKDPAAAIAWLKSLPRTQPGSDETYKNVTLTVYSQGTGPKVAATATGGVLLVGDEASVKAAVDRDGKDGLAGLKSFKAAMAGISGDQVSRTYLDFKGYFAALSAMEQSLGAGSVGMDQALLDKLPGWAGIGGRVESDALVSDIVTPLVDGAPKVADAESAIAGHLPGSTLALVEAHDYGKLIAAQLGQLKTDPNLADGFKQVDQTLAAIGGVDHLVGWVGDLAIVVTADGGAPGGGLVIVPTSVDAANQLATQLRNIVALAGGSSEITIKDEPYGAGTISTIDLGDLSTLAQWATGSSGSGSALGLPISGHLEISYTIQGGVAIVGVGPAWVKSIVDVKAGSALADQARYKDAMGRVGTKNAASLFVDLSAIRKLAEPIVTQRGDSTYATDVKPYLSPFDVLAGASRTSDGRTLSRYVITVINPQ